MTRVEAFSDGVYAIVVTLLVLELDVPEASDRLFGRLIETWPSFLGYLVSFAFIGGSWVSHVKLTTAVSVADDRLIGLNLLKLLSVSFLPFTTSLLATHLGGEAQRLVAVLFGASLTLSSALSIALYEYASRHECLLREGGRAILEARRRERWQSTLLLAAASLLAAFYPTLAVAFYLAISALILIRPLFGLRLAKRSPGPDPAPS